MNKTVSTSFTILCLLSIVFLTGYQTSVKASSHLIHVPTDFPTIQEAINNATDGDTIFVHKGTYNEQVIVNKTISLIGEDRHSTIIDGNETGSVISVTANNVNINGFTVQNSGSTGSDSGICITSNGNNISRNAIINNKNGIYLNSSSSNVISHNNVYSNDYGINLYYSNNNIYSDNNVSLNYNGINLYYSNNNIVSHNNIYSNNNCGIWICQLSNNNIISDNNVYSNNYGINLYYSNNNIVSHNNIYSNYNGIYLYYNSINNLIYNDNISNNNCGINLHYSSNNNTIHHNNFINNKDQVLTDSVNVWNNNYEGNYWSNYNGTDTDQDGIGGTPYSIDVNNQDNHPLMGMFSDFKITWKQETYHVTTICNSTISNFKFKVETETGNKIISFSVTGKDDAIGFCRVATPTNLINYPCIVLIDEGEIVPTLLNVSDKTHFYLYFTYIYSSHTITIISSKLLYLYNQLLEKYAKLQTDFDHLNSTYHELLNSHNTLLANYSQLLERYGALNLTTHELLQNYSTLLTNYIQLLESYNALNLTTNEVLDNYSTLLADYSQLLENHNILNLTTQELLHGYSTLLANYTQLLERYELQANYTSLLSEHEQNIRSLIYVFIATTTIFIIAAAYLSTHAHRKASRK